MVGADLESLVSSHDQSCLAILFVPEQSNISSASFLPFFRLAIKLEQLGPHFESLLLGLFVGLCVHFLGQSNDGFKLDVDFLFIGLVLSPESG